MMMILDGEKVYVREYNLFVRGMSYAPDNNLLSFRQAMDKLRTIVKAIID
jgi:hypothetical protein